MQEQDFSRKVWVLTEVYYPETTSTGYFLSKISEGLACSYPVSVLTGPATINFKPVSAPSRQVVNAVEIVRCTGTTFSKNRLIGRLINAITRSVAIFFKALFLCSAQDIILVVTNPPLLPFIVLFLQLLKGCPFVLLVHDVYPEALIATGLTPKNSVLSQILTFANQMLYQKASQVITLGRDMRQLVYQKLSSDQRDKVHCIPNWADTTLVCPMRRQDNSLLQELGVGDRFVVLYAGNIGRTHDVELIIRAAIVIADEEPKTHFIFVGSGAKEQWLRDTMKSQCLSNVNVLPFLPETEKNISLNACDVAIISFVPDMAGVSVPSRMYNQMAAGKPIIAVADEWTELAQVILEEKIGWVVSPGNLKMLVQTINYAAQHPELCEEMGARAASVAQSKYTFSKADAAYKSLFSKFYSPGGR